MRLFDNRTLKAANLLLMLMLLTACGSSYRAPVDELGGQERFLDAGRTHRVNAGETLYAVAWMYDLDFNLLATANQLSEPYTLVTGQTLLVDLRSLGQSGGTRLAGGTLPTNQVNNTVALGTVGQREGVRASPVQTGGGIQRATLPESEPLAPQPVLPEEAISTPPPPPVMPPRQLPATVASESAANADISWDWPAQGRIIGNFSDNNPSGKGIDIQDSRGAEVKAAADGEIVYAGSGLLRYGNLVIVKHSSRFLSAYAHNDSIAVKEGDKVRKGQKIAAMGSSGIDKVMLHFEIRMDGNPVDPVSYLPAR